MRNEYQVGDYITLKTFNNNYDNTRYRILDTYTENGKNDKYMLKVCGPDGCDVKIHKSRIYSVFRNREEIILSKLKKPQIANVIIQDVCDSDIKPVKKKCDKGNSFDLKKFASEHGNILLTKACCFDHSSFKVYSHIIINDVDKIYYTINTYHNSSGITTGKKSIPLVYPLNGKKIIRDNKTIIGQYSCQQLVNKSIKKGYKSVRF